MKTCEEVQGRVKAVLLESVSIMEAVRKIQALVGLDISEVIVMKWDDKKRRVLIREGDTSWTVSVNVLTRNKDLASVT
ncbi:hypothetical protein KJ766_03020 [Patescibacteria group bacterium]|nr:hypothetical protein [Patescibacteria group bacterium]